MEKRGSWEIQKAVWYALFVRELKTRFGGFRLGYFWAIAEPLSHILVLSFLFTAIGNSGYYGVPFPVFFGTGILSFFVFQKVVLTSQNSISVNKGLFVYRQVKPFDSILVRAFIEFLILLFTITILAWIGSWFFGYTTAPFDLLRALMIIVIIFCFGLGLGCFTAVLGELSPETSKFVPILMRPLYFVSGIFFPLEAMPQQFQEILLWNPLLHGVEQFRQSFVEDYPAQSTSIWYLLEWTLPVLAFGLAYYHVNRTRVLMT